MLDLWKRNVDFEAKHQKSGRTVTFQLKASTLSKSRKETQFRLHKAGQRFVDLDAHFIVFAIQESSIWDFYLVKRHHLRCRQNTPWMHCLQKHRINIVHKNFREYFSQFKTDDVSKCF